MSLVADFLQRIESCPDGGQAWRQWEDICIDVLTFLFVPPLELPKIQARSHSGIDRRDAIFPNRNDVGNGKWAYIRRSVDARLILCEFKNYDRSDIGKDEVNQARNYLNSPMGRLALLCCNKPPVESAYIKRNTVFSEEQKVILFLMRKELREMVLAKERGEDPADLIIDLIEQFFIEHE